MAEDNPETGHDDGGGGETKAALYYPDKYDSRDKEFEAVKLDRTRAGMLLKVFGEEVDEDTLAKVAQKAGTIDKLNNLFRNPETAPDGFRQICEIMELDPDDYLKGTKTVTKNKSKKLDDDDDDTLDDDDIMDGVAVKKLLQKQADSLTAAFEAKLKALEDEIEPTLKGQRRKVLAKKFGDLAEDEDLLDLEGGLEKEFADGKLSQDEISFFTTIGAALVRGKLPEKMQQRMGKLLESIGKKKRQSKGEPGGGGAGPEDTDSSEAAAVVKKFKDDYRKIMRAHLGIKTEKK